MREIRFTRPLPGAKHPAAAIAYVLPLILRTPSSSGNWRHALWSLTILSLHQTKLAIKKAYHAEMNWMNHITQPNVPALQVEDAMRCPDHPTSIQWHAWGLKYRDPLGTRWLLSVWPILFDSPSVSLLIRTVRQGLPTHITTISNMSWIQAFVFCKQHVDDPRMDPSDRGDDSCR